MPRPDNDKPLTELPPSLSQERGSERLKIRTALLIVGLSVFALGVLNVIPKPLAILGLGLAVIAAATGNPRHRWDC